MSVESIFRFSAGSVPYTPVADSIAGEVRQLADGRAGILESNTLAGEPGALVTSGQWDANSASAVVFAKGEEVFWSVSGNTAIVASSAVAGDFPVGAAIKAKIDGELYVSVDINATLMPWYPPVAQDAKSGAGAISVATYCTKLTSTGAQATTLADGSRRGQLKKIQLIVDGGDSTLTPVHLSGGTTVVFADAGDFVVLLWNGATWIVLEAGNDADGVTAPVVA